MWAAKHETRAEIVDRYRLAWKFTDATIAAFPIDAPGGARRGDRGRT